MFDYFTQNNDGDTDVNRRNFMRAAAAAGITGLAGCNTQSQTPATTNNSNTTTENNDTSNQTTQQQEEDEGLQLGFTPQDIWQAETQFYQQNANLEVKGTSSIDAADPSHIQNADLNNYNEFQDALVTTVNEIIHTLGENASNDSSTLTNGAAAATNLVLQNELENNEAYNNLDIKMVSDGGDAHGWTYAISTHHPLTVVDSNEPIVGPIKQDPLDERNTHDPIPEFTDKTFKEVTESERSTYRGFPKRVYSGAGEGQLYVGITPDVVDDFYEEAVFADDGELWMGSVRDAVATLSYMMEADYFEDTEAVGITTFPENLPEIEESNTFDGYVEGLLENDVEQYPTVKQYKKRIFDP